MITDHVWSNSVEIVVEMVVKYLYSQPLPPRDPRPDAIKPGFELLLALDVDAILSDDSGSAITSSKFLDPRPNESETLFDLLLAVGDSEALSASSEFFVAGLGVNSCLPKDLPDDLEIMDCESEVTDRDAFEILVDGTEVESESLEGAIVTDPSSRECFINFKKKLSCTIFAM